MRELGTVQAAILRALRQNGYWHWNAGWYWKSRQFTKKKLDRLVALGHVREENGRYTPT